MLTVPYSDEYAIAQALTRAVVVAASSGANTLVAAPGALRRLVVQFLKGQRTSGSSATTAVLIKMGSSSIDYGSFDSVDGLLFWSATSEMELVVLPENTALIADHSAANSITYTVAYLTLDM